MTAAQFKRRRQALFSSTYKAAAALGVSQGAVAHWEIGRRPVPKYISVTLSCLERIAKLEDLITAANLPLPK
jgi:DNA-binding transcriptional regulator YiaG